jgi:hypothetical protein
MGTPTREAVINDDPNVGSYIVELQDDVSSVESSMAIQSPPVSARPASYKVTRSATFSTESFGSKLFTAGVYYWAPYWSHVSGNVSAIRTRYTVAPGVGEFAKVGIYSVNASGEPGALIAETGDMNTQGATALTNFPLSQTIELLPGWYYQVFVANAAITMMSLPLGYVPTMLGALADAYSSTAAAQANSGVESYPESMPQNFSNRSGATATTVQAGNTYFPVIGLMLD